jgi:hypothetical protein
MKIGGSGGYCGGVTSEIPFFDRGITDVPLTSKETIARGASARLGSEAPKKRILKKLPLLPAPGNPDQRRTPVKEPGNKSRKLFLVVVCSLKHRGKMGELLLAYIEELREHLPVDLFLALADADRPELKPPTS